MEPNWTNIIPEFLTITEMEPSTNLNTKNFRHTSSKELVITEAKKLIRHEKFQQLGEIKREKILAREINQFRDNLEMNRNLNRMHLEAAQELAQLEKKHRQIRAITTKAMPQELVKKPPVHDFSEVPKNFKICNKKTPILPATRLESKDLQKQPSSLDPKKHKEEGNGTQSITESKATETSSKTTQKKKNPQPEKKNSEFIKNYVALKKKHYYWTKWKIYVAAKRKEKTDEKILREKINNFMQRLHDRSQHQSNKQEEKVQRRKTAPAKATSSPDQDLKEISEAIEQSAAETRSQLRSKSVQSSHPSLKTKAKLIRLITTVTPQEEEITQDPIQFPSPQLLIEMNRKHDERKQRLIEIQEKKRRIEEEKDRIVKEKYEQQLLEAEQEKRRKIREFREKLRRERIEQEKRQLEWKRLKILNQSALQHYERKLVLKYGMKPWLSLVEHRRGKYKAATEFNEKRMKRSSFWNWREALQQIQDEKTTKALALHAKQLLKTWFHQWREVCFKRIQQLQVAQDWHELVLIRDAFQAWLDYIYIEQREYQDKWDQATRFYKINLLRKCTKHWMLLPQILYLEREKEHRKRAWREKVQQVLPDFTPLVQTDL